MISFRELRVRDFVIITVFILIQLFDSVITYAFFRFEINPVAISLGKELFLIYKIIVTGFVILMYCLQYWNTHPRGKIFVEILMTLFASTPLIALLYRTIF